MLGNVIGGVGVGGVGGGGATVTAAPPVRAAKATAAVVSRDIGGRTVGRGCLDGRRPVPAAGGASSQRDIPAKDKHIEREGKSYRKIQEFYR